MIFQMIRFNAAVTSIESPLGDVSGSGQDWIIGRCDIGAGELFMFSCSKSFDENLPAGQTFELRFIVRSW